ncbi:pyridoxamine 5'-phosphate oxidase family protein [Actinophytocola xanthii]|uniref:Pyridoxamine 5'-phosphate oxidase n=1 Tax=Actinophytocola xanthii TaxID=1912961 RepID=A0A1Q8CLR4_9PSEU|nr:pyridoxamine 5'-phosphate oxidase family protein [Actinophytocola xanthii]OLF15298.1 pyridoxamine 5'-phosphate oxidase [Actinophytocola xanthii]
MTAAVRQGDPALLDTDLARRLLAADIPARLAFVAPDGTPRVLPINFLWTGEEVVMAGFRPSAKTRALRARPAVALTIDTAGPPPEVLLVRGRAEITEVDGVVPEYETMMRRGMPADQADAYLGELRRRGTPMERIIVRPEWVGVLDFQTRFPAAMPDFLTEAP